MTKTIEVKSYMQTLQTMIDVHGFEPEFALKAYEKFLDRHERLYDEAALEEDIENSEKHRKIRDIIDLVKSMKESDHCDMFDEDEPCDDGMDECPCCGDLH